MRHPGVGFHLSLTTAFVKDTYYLPPLQSTWQWCHNICSMHMSGHKERWKSTVFKKSSNFILFCQTLGHTGIRVPSVEAGYGKDVLPIGSMVDLPTFTIQKYKHQPFMMTNVPHNMDSMRFDDGFILSRWCSLFFFFSVACFIQETWSDWWIGGLMGV